MFYFLHLSKGTKISKKKTHFEFEKICLQMSLPWILKWWNQNTCFCFLCNKKSCIDKNKSILTYSILWVYHAKSWHNVHVMKYWIHMVEASFEHASTSNNHDFYYKKKSIKKSKLSHLFILPLQIVVFLLKKLGKKRSNCDNC